MTPGSEMHSSVRDVLNVVFRHKRKIVAIGLSSLVLIVAATVLISPIFEAEAKLRIRLGRNNLSVPTLNKEAGITVLHDRESQKSMVQSEMDILTSRALLEKIIDEFGEQAFLEGDYSPPDATDAGPGLLRPGKLIAPVTRFAGKVLEWTGFLTPQTERERALAKLIKGLSVNAAPDSNTVDVRLESKNRYLARDALNLLVRLYLDRHIEINASKAEPSFFEEQADGAHAKLEQTEQALSAFRDQHGIHSIEYQQEHLLIQIVDLESQYEMTVAEAEASRARITEIKEALAQRKATIELARTTGRHNFGGDAMKEKLLELRVEEVDLSNRFVDTYPPLVAVRKQIREAEQMLAGESDTHTEVTTGIDESYQNLQLSLETEVANLSAYEAKHQALLKDLEKHKANLDALSTQEVQLRKLERELTMAEEEFSRYVENVQQANISVALDRIKVSNVSVVQEAALPIRPIRPRKEIILPAGLLFSILLSFGLAYAFEYFDDTFRTDTDVQKRLGLPVLASVSEEEFSECT